MDGLSFFKNTVKFNVEVCVALVLQLLILGFDIS